MTKINLLFWQLNNIDTVLILNCWIFKLRSNGLRFIVKIRYILSLCYAYIKHLNLSKVLRITALVKILLGDSDTRVLKSNIMDILRFSMMTHSYQAPKNLRIFMYFIDNTEWRTVINIKSRHVTFVLRQYSNISHHHWHRFYGPVSVVQRKLSYKSTDSHPIGVIALIDDMYVSTIRRRYRSKLSPILRDYCS